MWLGKDLIFESADCNKIVTYTVDSFEAGLGRNLVSFLEARCDDSVKNGRCWEFWGETRYGATWRIHILTPEPGWEIEEDE